VLAADPGKRFTEKFILAWTPVWIAVVIGIMASHAFTRWGDVGHLAFPLLLLVPVYVAPFFAPDKGRYFWRFNLWIGVYSLLQMYFGSALFFDVLHMEYHFPVTWIVNRSPLFLYPLTIVYFSTYYVVMVVVWRAVQTHAAILKWPALVVIGYAVAFAETGGMANEWLRDAFSYRDKWFVLIWGSACYGSIFMLSLPFVFRLDEKPSWQRIVGEVLAVNMAALCVYEVWAVVLR
jgi:cycloeucalenol cycloisomerase